MTNTSCAFTGLRPMCFSFGFDEQADLCLSLKEVMAAEIGRLVRSGVSFFYTGMALGVDQWAAEMVLRIRTEHPKTALIAVLPCESQADKWSAEQRDRYFNILERCNEVITLNSRYTRSCMTERDHYLIDHAEHLLAVFDGRRDGGAANAIRYAREKNRSIISIHPETLDIAYPPGFGAKGCGGKILLYRPHGVCAPSGGMDA